MTPLIRPCLRGERGTSTIEFALGASLLFMSVVGTIYMAWALYTYNIVSEAAREGARYAIVRGHDCHFGSPCTSATSGDIQTYVQHLGFPGSSQMGATAAWFPSPGGGTCTPCTNIHGNQVQVTVTYSFPVAIPFVPQRTLSMSNTAEMVISQ
jgi:Flp pilus assembly protein TadG